MFSFTGMLYIKEQNSHLYQMSEKLENIHDGIQDNETLKTYTLNQNSYFFTFRWENKFILSISKPWKHVWDNRKWQKSLADNVILLQLIQTLKQSISHHFGLAAEAAVFKKRCNHIWLNNTCDGIYCYIISNYW